jgi:DNA-binding CsgD family transcriptional regulator
MARPVLSSASAPEATDSLAVSRDARPEVAHDTTWDPFEFRVTQDGQDCTLKVLKPVRSTHPVEVEPVAITRADGAIYDAEAPSDLACALADDSDDAVPQATAQVGRGQRPTALSERELSVAILVTRGRSNREIAEELVISRKTADAHVSHILTKLGLWRRVQIATWTLQHCAGVTGV